MKNAIYYGEKYYKDLEKLKIASLLHDIGKMYNHDEQLEYAFRNNIYLTEEDKIAKGVLHAYVGRYIAENELNIKDKEILDSIYYHTTGYENMTLFMKIIFVSDYMDEDRDLKEHKFIKELLIEDFEKGVLEIIKQKIKFVLEKNEYLHSNTLKFYNSQLLSIR